MSGERAHAPRRPSHLSMAHHSWRARPLLSLTTPSRHTMKTHTRSPHPLALLAVLLLAACQEAEEPAVTSPEEPVQLMCSEEAGAEIFEARVRPLIADEHPASCGRCHLPGIDFSQFLSEDACASIACMEEQAIISLTYPEQSKLLDWVRRGHEKAMRSLEDDPLVLAEHDALLSWVTYHARCNHEACPEVIENPCGTQPPLMEDMPRDMHGDDMPPDMNGEDMSADMMSEINACDRRAVEQKFAEEVWPWHGRCYHCHGETYSAKYRHDPKPAPWMSDDRSEAGAHLTARRLLQSTYLDLEFPSRSTILLKPLALEAGGVEHGGGSKIANEEDVMYVPLLAWIEHVSACQEP